MAKIDKVYEEMLRMEERFTKLEADQQRHFQEALDKAAASILAELRKEIGKEQTGSLTKSDLQEALKEAVNQIKGEMQECKCNKEILEAISKQKPTPSSSKDDKGKELTPRKPRTGKFSGWYPENLELPINPFTGKKI
ncbi:hypothetical protein QKU89_gp3 [Metaplexis yellow mottle-associated virus]|uniref:Uncharacterized protein n=1 Tax=Metaplexis yellow mottle-associated virus TaxID=2878269 RepID=A0A8K1M7X6_9VIRU|nr:hypothetical protein QKU89_gp3 [Metaplexis yellow mottle-associated virus]UBN09111.1 hypothetical protein [Metaplexis yellow mottle-associated virus]